MLEPSTGDPSRGLWTVARKPHLHRWTQTFHLSPSPIHLPPSGIFNCLDATLEAGHTPAPNPIPTIRDWAHLLHTHTHEEFVALALLQKDHSYPPCMDMSGAVLIRPYQIHHFVFGEWQGILEVQECLEGIFRLLQLDPSISLLQQPEIDQILCIGEAPTRWIRVRHFPPPGETHPYVHSHVWWPVA